MRSKSGIEKAYFGILKEINGKADLLAVSKFQSIDSIKCLANLGHKDFGENYLQELELKFAEIPHLNWHFIGSLQSRKIKNIIKCASTIHSVASFSHLDKIDKSAQSLDKKIDIFLQVNIDDDVSKSGFGSCDIDKILECINSAINMVGVNVVGLMCLPAQLDSSSDSFARMQKLFYNINSQLNDANKLKQLSMGMSGDYMDAIEHGSTMVRVGSNIFGPRYTE